MDVLINMLLKHDMMAMYALLGSGERGHMLMHNNFCLVFCE